MAEVAVQKSVCGSCGAGIREGSVFCYSCGEPIPPVKKPEVGTQTQTAPQNGRPSIESDVVVPDLPKITGEPFEEEKPGEKRPAAEERPMMRSAASMRQGTRAYNRKPVEVVWVEREGVGAFIIVSIVLVVLSAILLALALYLK